MHCGTRLIPRVFESLNQVPLVYICVYIEYLIGWSAYFARSLRVLLILYSSCIVLRKIDYVWWYVNVYVADAITVTVFLYKSDWLLVGRFWWFSVIAVRYERRDHCCYWWVQRFTIGSKFSLWIEMLQYCLKVIASFLFYLFVAAVIPVINV